MVCKEKGRFHVVLFSLFPFAAFGLAQSPVRIKMRVALNNTSAHSAHARARTHTHTHTHARIRLRERTRQTSR
jgi:hypothetical protein